MDIESVIHRKNLRCNRKLRNKTHHHIKTHNIMADLTRMEELIVKRLHGKLKPKEEKELKALAQASEENRQFIERISPKAVRKMRQAAKGVDSDRIDRLTKQKIGNVPGVLDWLPETRPNKFFRAIMQFLRHFGRPPA